MRHLRYYRELEDAVRKDDLEGKAKVISQGHVCHLSETGDMTFILCASSPEVEISNTEKFGDSGNVFRAKICNPSAFTKSLNAHLGMRYPKQYAGDARILEVRYIKDEGTYPDHTKSTLQEDIDAIVSHKPALFADEKEYRIVCSFMTGTMDGLDALQVELGKVEGVIAPFAYRWMWKFCGRLSQGKRTPRVTWNVRFSFCDSVVPDSPQLLAYAPNCGILRLISRDTAGTGQRTPTP